MKKLYISVEHEKDYVVYSVKNTETGESIKEGNPMVCKGAERLADHAFVQEQLRSLTGEILTIIDAVIPEGKQNKATKDLIRQAFVDKHSLIGTAMLDQEEINKIAEESFEAYVQEHGKIPPTVSLEEAIGM